MSRSATRLSPTSRISSLGLFAGLALLLGCSPIAVPAQTTVPSTAGIIEESDLDGGIYTITLSDGVVLQIDRSEVREFLTTSLPLDAGYLALFGEDAEGPWYLALAHLQCGSAYKLDGPAIERDGSIVFTTGLQLPMSDRFVPNENGEYGDGHFCVTQDGTIDEWHNTGR